MNVIDANETVIQNKVLEREKFLINYWITGNQNSNVTTVFLNGLFHGKDAWVKQIRDLDISSFSRLLFIDYRDCGLSQSYDPENVIQYNFDDIVNDIGAVLKYEEIYNALIVGYSIGGQFAIRLCSQFPDRVSSMVLLNTSLEITGHAFTLIDMFKTMLMSSCDTFAVYTAIYPCFFSSKYLTKLRDLKSSILQSYVDYNKNSKALLRFLNALQNKPNIIKDAKEISIDVTIVSSELDYIFNPETQKKLSEEIKDSKLILLPGCGHSSFIEQHKIVGKIINKLIMKRREKQWKMSW